VEEGNDECRESLATYGVHAYTLPPSLRRPRQEDEFETSMGYIARLCLKIPK
jgi:hypothetical protein